MPREAQALKDLFEARCFFPQTVPKWRCLGMATSMYNCPKGGASQGRKPFSLSSASPFRHRFIWFLQNKCSEPRVVQQEATSKYIHLNTRYNLLPPRFARSHRYLGTVSMPLSHSLATRIPRFSPTDVSPHQANIITTNYTQF